MALRLSTQTRNDMAGTMGLKEQFNGGWIDLYSGGQPSSSDYAETGTKIATISLSSGTASTCGVTFGTAAAGSIPKSSDIWSGTVLATGVIGWFRLYDINHTTGSNGTARRMDGNVGISGSDLLLPNTSPTLNSTVTIDEFTFEVPAS